MGSTEIHLRLLALEKRTNEKQKTNSYSFPLSIRIGKYLLKLWCPVSSSDTRGFPRCENSTSVERCFPGSTCSNRLSGAEKIFLSQM